MCLLVVAGRFEEGLRLLIAKNKGSELSRIRFAQVAILGNFARVDEETMEVASR